jgi:hypothetical protein
METRMEGYWMRRGKLVMGNMRINIIAKRKREIMINMIKMVKRRKKTNQITIAMKIRIRTVISQMMNNGKKQVNPKK